MKKLVRSLTTMLLICALTFSSFAMAADGRDSTASDTDYYISYDEYGNLTGYNMPVPLASTRRAEDGTYLKVIFIKNGSASNSDCGFHPDTDVWRRVSSYTFSKTTTTNMTISIGHSGKLFNGSIGVSAGTSTGFGFTVTADQTKDSKIRVNCDYDYTLNRGEVRNIYTDELIYSFDYSVITKTAERFVPYYR
ncbi:exported hypothetical protein [uncultured Eubacteriales bacterium]|uniref:Uncharacterized protein n=1 Tax=uncultured Eubacteriales bacterium TaxID=172733 RepID=A0A212JP22_9FIRM|nr:exported hypothetical protein [uncultured Eubacteriales bacterium]